MKSLKTHVAEVGFCANATLGEGACWDVEKQVLYWVDILECEVHVFDPIRGTDSVLRLFEHVSFVQPRLKGGVVVGTRSGVGVLDIEKGKFEMKASPEEKLDGNRFNDGKVGPDGRLYAGSLSYEGKQGAANFWRFESDFRYEKLLDGVTNSNGLCWSLDGKILYYIDTGLQRVDAFDFDVETGRISNRRMIWDVREMGGKPDGMTCDAEGFLWVALWGGGKVLRVNPRNGEVVGEVIAPCKNVTCPTFGGAELNVLYFTTAKKGRIEGPVDESPHAGDIFFAEVDTCGLPSFRFAG
ncbi:MAG: SMP-30/gluconolactonase/LRE family protein [Chthoniobacterales bacterium]|nr:SMP-30/gluconolactonase/LRE family protein [Chthoniobacterales bacterium]